MSKIDEEKEAMLAIADALGTAKSAAAGVARAITKIEVHEAANLDLEKALDLRAALNDARKRFKVALETAREVCATDYFQRLSPTGSLFDRQKPATQTQETPAQETPAADAGAAAPAKSNGREKRGKAQPAEASANA